MRNRKSLIWRLLPWVLLLAACAALVIFVGIPLYGTQEAVVENPPVVSYYEGDGKPLTMENDRLLFTMDPGTTRFTVTEKESGRVWASNPENADKDPIAQASNKEILSSTLLVTYTNSGGEVTLNNNTYSMANQTFDVKVQEDGSIRVDYSVGRIERVYQIPTAITKERYTAFTEKMSGSTKKKVSGLYTLVEPSKLDSRSDKDELIALYPTITEQAMYLLKSNTKANNKEKAEGYFEEAGYTAEDFAIDQQLVAASREAGGPVFNVTMIYRLEGGDLVVELPYSEMRYRSDYPLTYVSPLPMFGAAGTDEEGYLFIPEGGGALIHYNNGKLSQSPYYANLYGWDYGTQRKEAVSETENAFPVFGGTHQGGAFLCMIEGASAYAGVNADIAGRYNSYNTVYARYNVLHAEQYNVSAKTAQLVYIYEKEIPQDTIIQRYRFVDSEDYAVLANAYGDYLCEIHPELAESQAGENMPVNVELIGAINKKVVKFGLPVDSVVATTTFSQAREILKELTAAEIANLNLRMTGWANGGVRQKVLTGVHTLSQLGGEGEMKTLINAAREKQVRLYFDGISCFAYHSGLTDGFITFRDAARYATREQVHLYPYDIVTYQKATWMEGYYLVRPSYAADNASKLIAFLRDKGSEGIAFRDIGDKLSADYNHRDTVTREQAKEMNIATMKEARTAGEKISIKKGNDYALPYADLITDMNLTGQAYAIVDERIPFYQIAIHGMKDYTGEAINLSGDYRTRLLECAEYGAGLNFTFMAENTRILQDTAYSCYTSSGYTYWKDQLIPMICRYQQEMKGLNRLRITGHRQLAEEVTVTEYEDGTKVYVNFGSEDYPVGNVLVPARDYTVERGNP
ncbi:MAG: hypothetical protein IKE24_12340 [Clostridia bacterium]|nr:hypothetical protein [Clostridia bacterium]